MEVARIRQQGAEDFSTYYESLCALQDTCPVASIRAGVKECVLNCQAYRLKKADWHPLLTALQINRALHTVVFYNKWKERVYPALQRIGYDIGQKPARIPSVAGVASSVDKEVVGMIAKSLRECLCVSSALTSVVLEGLPLTLRDCKSLVKGLQKTCSLTHLSFKGSTIGDKGAEVLSNAVRNSHTLEWLDLTACGLTAQGAMSLATLIKHQCLCKQSAAWKDSLRFRTPQLGQMPGLRRVTLNLNPEIGDRGARELSEALRDDVCLKALDLQSCRITTEGASHFQEVLRLNTTIIILDLRANLLLDDDVLDAVHEQLSINVAGMHPTEESYMWLEIEVERISLELRHLRVPPASQKRASHHHQQCGGVKPVVVPHRVKRSGGGVLRRGRGVPWRAEARSAQRWKSLFCQQSTIIRTKSSKSPASGVQLTLDDGSTESILYSDSNPEDQSKERWRNDTECSRKACGSSSVVVMSAEKLKEIKVELSACQHQLKQETAARVRAEAQVLELELENRKLRAQLKRTQSEPGLTPTVMVEPNHSSGLNDEETLDAIETAFKQFNSFLDLMQDKGLGEICALLDAAKLEAPV